MYHHFKVFFSKSQEVRCNEVSLQYLFVNYLLMDVLRQSLPHCVLILSLNGVGLSVLAALVNCIFLICHSTIQDCVVSVQQTPVIYACVPFSNFVELHMLW